VRRGKSPQVRSEILLVIEDVGQRLLQHLIHVPIPNVMASGAEDERQGNTVDYDHQGLQLRRPDQETLVACRLL
jgi:hypothetical protein